MTKFLIPFQEDGKWGYKDKDGNVVIPPKLEAAGEFSLGIAQIKINNQIQYIDSYGTILDISQSQAIEDYNAQITDSGLAKSYNDEITDR